MNFFKLQIFFWAFIAVVSGYALNITKRNTGCLMREFGKDKIVCVCNAEHCDSLIPDITRGKINVFTSTIKGARYSKSIHELEKSATAGKLIVIDRTKTYQSIIGWGGAFTDSTGINVNSLPHKVGEKLMRSYFAEDGSRYNLGRVPMGGTDFSTHSYSYDDGDADKDLRNFALAPEDFKYKIPLIKRALNLSKGKTKFLTAAWTIPKWMKKIEGGYLKDEYYQTWVNYFLKFLRAYKQKGIDFWGLSTGNEPSLAVFSFKKINTVTWNSELASLWIRENLGPTIRNSEFSDLKLLAIDDQRLYFPGYASKVMENISTRNFIDGFAVHWYENFLIGPKVLSETHDRFPDKFILSTEASTGYMPFFKHVDIGAWGRGESYVKDIIDNLNNWVTGWVDWNLALNLEGGPTYIKNFVDSPILVNAEAGEFYKQPMYYAIGHFSKFVPENSVRIDVSSNIRNVQVVGFITPGDSKYNHTVLVILNKNYQSTAVSFKDGTSFINLNVEAKSFTTVVY
ncbi:hypothetical protein WA026_019034 [Henosepilachna vigintioctopunctata]|uniref:Glucosylceramidase n=1 Tax=Henosepilachna vigintioctopunctata TaxID=420089 RepID=A0AAW1VHG4_9CUCU